MDNDDKKYIPALRFPEFLNDGEWESMKIGDAIITITPPKKLVSSEYKEKGKYPIIDQSLNYIAGYSDDETAVIHNNNKYYIVFGDHTCTLKLINFPFAQGADGIKIFCSKHKFLLTGFLYQYILANPVISKEYKRHFSDLKEKCLLYPTKIEEQTRITDCLLSLDNYIDTIKCKLEQLKEHKRGLMQRLFPAKGKTISELRFPEFRDIGEWETIKIGDAIKTITPPKKLVSLEYKEKGKYPIIDQSLNHIAGYSDDETAVIHNNNKYYIVFGDHTCTLKLINFPFVQGADGIKIFCSKHKFLLTGYLYQYILANPIISKEYKRHFSDLKEKVVTYPTEIEEQTKIVNCLLSLDKIIKCYENKIYALGLYKKGVMQKLFTKH